MAIPGSVLSNVMPFGTGAAVEAYPSVATLRPITKMSDTAGQETHTFADSTDPTQTGLKCRMSPLIQVRPQNQENAEGQGFQRAEAKFQVNFLAYINVAIETLQQWQVKVDGLVYQIKSVESDGNRLTTRLMVSDSLPFNA